MKRSGCLGSISYNGWTRYKKERSSAKRTRKNTREAGKQTCGAGNKPFQKCNKQIQKDGIFGETDKVQRKTKEDFWAVF